MEPSKEEYKDFQSFLEARNISKVLRKAVAKDGLTQPTTLQKKLIPIIQEGQKHILVKYEEQAGTKLGLYLPIVNSLIESKVKSVLIVLTYSKERINELTEFFTQLITFRKDCLRIQGIFKSKELEEEFPNILITNPKVFIELTKNKELKDAITTLVIEQLDKQLLMGFEDDLKDLSKEFSNEEDEAQIIITIKETDDTNTSIQEIKQLFMASALVIRFRQSIPSIEEKLAHYYYRCTKEESFVLLYVLIKLHTIYGKTLIKVGDIFEGYKVKIFLNRIGVNSQVLNPEMPSNTQKNIIQNFNQSHFDYLMILGNEKNLKLQNVRNIIFFNIAANYGEYSKIVNQVSFNEGYIVTLYNDAEEEAKLHRIEEKQKTRLGGIFFTEFPIKRNIVDSFSYRVRDAITSITHKAIKSEKAKELKRQILGNKKLKHYFEEHPQEKEILEKELSGKRRDDRSFASLRVIPDYLLPKEPLLANPVEIKLTDRKSVV